MGILQQVITEVNPSTCAVVFTFADEKTTFNIEYGKRWYEELILGVEGMPSIPQERIYLFKGNGNSAQNISATTTEELK